MTQSYDVIVMGGGVLGCSSAIAIKRRLESIGESARVAVCDKSLVGAGLSGRHSGIVRAANANGTAAAMAATAMNYWQDLEAHWGVTVPYDISGAIWIARDAGDNSNPAWERISKLVKSNDIDFHQIDSHEAASLCPAMIQLNEDEVFYYEPQAMQFQPSDVRRGLYKALAINGISLYENAQISGFQVEGNQIVSVQAGAEWLGCGQVVNAAGAWSPAILAQLGLTIPVGSEAVYVANWMVSDDESLTTMPIIADYVNLAYFRYWPHGEIHMHQPRQRSMQATARAFAETPLAGTGADFIYDPFNNGLGYSQISHYESIASSRFPEINSHRFSSGYRSYFDITPDLQFILGPDTRIPNILHCLGAGQAFKYAPLFGELMADYATGQNQTGFVSDEFSLARFDKEYMKAFWEKVSNRDYSLERESTSL